MKNNINSLPLFPPKKEKGTPNPHEEEYFQKDLNKLDDVEDPLKVFIEYIKWLEENKTKNNQTKIFELLEKVTKTFYLVPKYQQDERFLTKWLKYVDLCSDDEDILTFMKDHEIGTSFVMFYQVFGIVCERKRDFISTNKILLEGMQKKAQPMDKMSKLIKEFEQRMLERLDRDFYSQGLNLKDETQNEGSKLQNDNPKKRKFVGNDSIKELPLKKIKFVEKMRETVKIGEIDIYVDEQFRNQINISTQLVEEYQALCKKYNFWLEIPINPLNNQSSKPLSWITKENFLYKFESCGKGSKNKDMSKFSLENKMSKISEEGSSIGSSGATTKNLVIEKKESPQEKVLEKQEEKLDEKEKENFYEYFSKKIEEKINDFFVLPIPKKKCLLQSSQKKSSSNIFLVSSSNNKRKNNNNQDHELFNPSPINLRFSFEELNKSPNQATSFHSELEEVKIFCPEKHSNFFSNEKEKEKFFALSFGKEKKDEYEEIENVRNAEFYLFSGSPKRNIDNTLNFESSPPNDHAFLIDSNEKNGSKDELVDILHMLEEKDLEKENVNSLKKKTFDGKSDLLNFIDEKEIEKENANALKRKTYDGKPDERRKNVDRKALQELPIEEMKIQDQNVNLEKILRNLITECNKSEGNGVALVKEEKNLNLNNEDDDDFDDFFRKTVLNSGLSGITQNMKETS